MAGSGPHGAGPHQPEPTRSQQQGNFPNPKHGRNEEKGRFREGSVDTTQISRSHTRVGSHMSQKRDDERAMQREINDLKRRLCFAQRRQSTPDDPARPLKASSQRPSSQARFFTKFIVLGLLGLDLLTSTVKGALKSGPYNWRRLWEELGG